MSYTTSMAFWTLAPGHGVLRSQTLEAPGPEEVLVEALYSGVSRGTESLVFTGRVPPSEYQRMRAPFQEGDFPGPLKYGYASVGRVVEGPEALRERTVFCLYPHQQRYVVPASAVHPLPDDVPAERAVLAANLETAINGVWDAAPGLGDRICVIGAGVVGTLVAWLCAGIPGTQVCLVDIEPQRASLARALGLTFTLPDEAPRGNDLVIHASGHPSGLETAIRVAAREATLLEMSWYGEQPVAVSLGGAFHAQRLTLRSSQVGGIAPQRQPRWDFRRRLELALRLLAEPRLDALISGETPFASLPDEMPRLVQGAGKVLCHRIRYTPT
ncbi:2-desacetyl-2-hydroxyethyl bacteriochlorophyllide A dehydrogenase [Franzmannia pantelleriensis]|uniref:2-desacetyl-2-hydroxyethyl bacteriochlorophyllide A dehydrogenase n=1 Tax=Franzmannia pantelleriensis TaxID=48727 RepID=A0A1G9G8Q4_9GAMM|nr:zinc-binding alcohol dehydrogenase [Halomonas pantelleriensis]SDK96673.1 2-desacetyl-2-hydroxyethyl bacteriochlorophyllide A dehydrogenase [Halomonas pantelleriensis]